jgi:aerobic C4-dicarboxylate transport protein
MKFFTHLYVQVLVGILLGVALGAASPEWGERMQPLGSLFISLIKMVIAPIIFCTVVTGIVHMGDMRKAGVLGFKALVYFEVLTTLALILGLLVGNLSGAGMGMGVDPASLEGVPIPGYTPAAEAGEHNFITFLLELVPHSFLGGVTEGNLLQTLLTAILFAWAMLGMGNKAKPVIDLIETVSHVFFRIVGIIMRLAPLGAFGAMAFTIGKYGFASLAELFGFVLLFYGTCLLFVLVVLGGLLKLATGLSIFQLIRYIKSELVIVLGTSSSETVLPRILEKLERLGCERQVVGMVVPTGYSFNLDGTSLYFTMAVIFLAHALGIDLSMSQQFSILAVLLFTSKGAAGVVGSAFVVLAGTLGTVNIIPVAAVTLILGIDRFMSEGRALTNLVGNCVATLVIARWQKALDIPHAKAVLAGEIVTKGETETVAVTRRPRR